MVTPYSSEISAFAKEVILILASHSLCIVNVTWPDSTESTLIIEGLLDSILTSFFVASLGEILIE